MGGEGKKKKNVQVPRENLTSVFNCLTHTNAFQ